MTDDPTDQAREDALHRLKTKQSFRYTAFSYVVINIFLWIIWALTSDHEGFPPWPLWVTVGWGFALAFMAWNAYGRKPISDADIEREMGRG